MRASLNLCQPQFVHVVWLIFWQSWWVRAIMRLVPKPFGILGFWVAPSFLGAIVIGAMPMVR